MKDLVQLELIRESLIAVVNEMRANIIHSSYAPIIYEGHDFSCALMSADGRQVAQGRPITRFIFSPFHIRLRRLSRRSRTISTKAICSCTMTPIQAGHT